MTLWLDDIAAIQAAVPDVVVELAGGCCPWQADGYVKSGIYGGFRWYMRYRHDEATLYIYYAGDEPTHDDFGYAIQRLENTLYYCEIMDAMGREDGSVLSPGEAAPLFLRLWERLRPIDQWESTSIGRLNAAVNAYAEALQDKGNGGWRTPVYLCADCGNEGCSLCGGGSRDRV